MGSTPTISDIAREAGVGYGTAARALSGNGYVSPATKRRVVSVAHKLNYHPNRVARSLALGRSEYVALFAAPGLLAYLGHTLESMERSLRQAGYSLTLHTFTESRQSEAESLRELLQRRPAGVIAAPGTLDSPREPYQDLLDHGVKVVVMEKYIDGLAVPQIIGDDHRYCYLSAQYLLSLGHRRIANLCIPTTCHAGRERLRGFRDAHSEAGVVIDEALIVPTEVDEIAGERATAQLLRLPNRPTAVITRSDYVAVGAMRAALSAGLSVPDDISIASFGDIRLSEMLRVPLTTIHASAEQMTGLAVAALLQALSGEEAEPRVVHVDASLIVRGSCAPPHS